MTSFAQTLVWEINFVIISASTGLVYDCEIYTEIALEQFLHISLKSQKSAFSILLVIMSVGVQSFLYLAQNFVLHDIGKLSYPLTQQVSLTKKNMLCKTYVNFTHNSFKSPSIPKISRAPDCVNFAKLSNNLSRNNLCQRVLWSCTPPISPLLSTSSVPQAGPFLKRKFTQIGSCWSLRRSVVTTLMFGEVAFGLSGRSIAYHAAARGLVKVG